MGNPPSRHRGNVGSPGSCSGQEDGQVVDAAAGVFHQLPGCWSSPTEIQKWYWLIYWLVVEPTPLKSMSSSVGMMTFPIYGKMKNVPNHQPVYIYIDIDIDTTVEQLNINETWNHQYQATIDRILSYTSQGWDSRPHWQTSQTALQTIIAGYCRCCHPQLTSTNIDPQIGAWKKSFL